MAKSLTLYSHKTGPNPWKVAIVLEELGLEYETIYLDMNTKEQKEPAFTKINPNGRLPALVDHSNGDFAIWESGAIILYLIGKYDTEHKLSFADFNSTALANQYLMFQMSGQGPYFGQLGWFAFYHEEKIPSAIERYVKEVHRVLGVLDNILEGKQYLVDEKVSYADISFIPWNWMLDLLADRVGEWRPKYPNVAAWDNRLHERASVKKCKEQRRLA